MSKIEYRKINFPKINWDENDEEDSVPKLSKDIYNSLKDTLNAITNRQPINPNIIKDGLRSINFHKDNPDIYKIIEEMCLEYELKGKDMTTQRILDYIISNLSDIKTRKGLNLVFNEIKNKRTGEITPKELEKISNENEESLNEKDYEFILKTISENPESYNINQDEFYYIMTKSPKEALNIILATKSSKVK
jgi:Ca2+-binding EF-hand superfamily protein